MNGSSFPARAAVPYDVAVEGPGARVVGVDLQYDVAKGGTICTSRRCWFVNVPFQGPVPMART